MNTISYRRIREFITSYPTSSPSLNAWYRIAKAAEWRNIEDVRQVYPHADKVGRFIVFNILGNNYRLIAEIHFDSRLVLIRHILTHDEYEKGKWKQ